MGSLAGELERLLADDIVEGLGRLPMEDVRARRALCDELEVALSYLRRLVQGRIDIVQAEFDRRTSGGDAGLARLVEQLPEILAKGVRSSSAGRLPTHMEPTGDVDYRGLTAELDCIVDPDGFSRLPALDDSELASIAEQLVDLERRVSAQRRSLHERLDLIQAEIVRRYRSGEATVDGLLQSDRPFE